MEATCSSGVICISEEWDRRFEQLIDFDGALSDSDEDVLLRWLVTGIIAVGRDSQSLLLDGFFRLWFSAWLLMVMALGQSRSLKWSVLSFAKFCEVAHSFAPSKSS